MALPRKLKNMNLFNQGRSYIGEVPSVTLPKLTRKLDEYRGGGMDGTVSSGVPTILRPGVLDGVILLDLEVPVDEGPDTYR